MAAEKRPASNAFGSSQLVVKRQKSNVDLSDGNATGRTVMQAGILEKFLRQDSMEQGK
ncbi:MAG: hypothetical protein LQ341_001990 [Variospora aurantia]|nr:MAG: hypothetical protein LQ341_001990 [Variospora aurantia]